MSSSAREALRNFALKSRSAKSQIVEFEGQKYEVRAPSVRARGQILIKAGVAEAPSSKKEKAQEKPQDLARMQVVAVIACTFVPGTDEHVFEDADFDGLANAPAGSLVDLLAEPALSFLHLSLDKDAAKNG